MADDRGVSTVRIARSPRSVQTRLAGIIGVLIATALASAIAALAMPQASASSAPSRQVTFGAFDVVRPTAVDIVFAKPQAPRAAARPAPVVTTTTAPRATRVRAAVATTSSLCAGADWQRRRGEAALASLLQGLPAGVTIAYLPGGGALKGMTYYDQHHVDVYVASCSRESDTLLRHVVAHELGHAWDSLHMTDALRADYLAARGIPAGTRWFGCNACKDFATPAGDFAETYAQWQRGASDSRSQLAPPATPAQLDDLARFFR
jgi:hypothetical protein